jgi:hypothetical protein
LLVLPPISNMKFFTTAAGLALSTLVAAAPAPGSPFSTKTVNGQQVVSYVAKFDDTNAGTAAGAPIRGLTPLGPYHNLYYDNLGVIPDGAAVAGLKPQSAPNVLAYDVVASLQGTQQIRADYDDSITDYFNFKSLVSG